MPQKARAVMHLMVLVVLKAFDSQDEMANIVDVCKYYLLSFLL